ncbi:MAG: tyrosine--tRNA ligase [Acidimicrobiales bacterium]|jgi:tyrosyl-tRNA synthetase
MVKISEDLAFRGLVHQASDETLWPLLDQGATTAYAGFDPSSDSLHVGNLLGIITLRRLQLAGHRPILLAGGGTGLIGDPGGKSDERPLLSAEQLAANLEGIRAQLGGLLDMSEGAGSSKGLLLDNSKWLCSFGFVDFLREVGKHFTVNQMLAKESVKSRFERPDQGISYTEFSYMLLQAYDYLHLHDEYGCRLQLGGSDQWGNITMGMELIRKTRGAETFALTWPLLLRADGTKYGKSESGAVWLDPAQSSPYVLYQFFVRTPDEEVGRLLRFFTFLSRDEIEALDVEVSKRPENREAQLALARAVCTLVHGEGETRRAVSASEALFSEDISSLDEALLLEVFADAPSSGLSRTALDGDGLAAVDALVLTGLVASKTAARTALSQGGIYVNNRRRGEPEARLTRDDLLQDRYVVLRRGRRDYHLLRFE